MSWQVFRQSLNIIPDCQAQCLCPGTSAGTGKQYDSFHQGRCNLKGFPYNFLIRQVLKIYRSRLLNVFVIDLRQIQYFYVVELVKKDDAVHFLSDGSCSIVLKHVMYIQPVLISTYCVSISHLSSHLLQLPHEVL